MNEVDRKDEALVYFLTQPAYTRKMPDKSTEKNFLDPHSMLTRFPSQSISSQEED